MKIRLIFIASLILCLSFSSVSFFYVNAEDEEETNEEDSGKMDEKEEEVERLRKEVEGLSAQANTLAGEVAYLDGQVKLTNLQIQSSQAKIENTKKQIEKLGEEIEDLSKRIDKLEESIDYQRMLLNNRFRERYKNRDISPMMVLFGSLTLDNIVRKTEYIKQVEKQDMKLLDEMDSTKKSYNTQKDIFEDRKKEEEELKAKLEEEKANLDSYKKQLDDQKYEKEKLLEITQNNEAKYRELLAEAERELRQISGAVSVLRYQNGERVKKGDLIGYQGNTGRSTGEHLHFGVYKYSSFEDIGDDWGWYYSGYIDPKEKLESKSIYWNTDCESPGYKNTGKGKWRWPLSNPIISQGFGITCYSKRFYGGKPHPAYDMYGSYGTSIYAVADGKAYFCRNCLGDGANGVFIFHDDGYMTLYWHLR